MKYQLKQWRDRETNELKDTRYPNYDPRHNTGMMVESWGGWTWDANSGTYRTDAHGEGLWYLTSDGWKQARGTCQYSLPENRQRAIAIIKREFDLLLA